MSIQNFKSRYRLKIQWLLPWSRSILVGEQIKEEEEKITKKHIGTSIKASRRYKNLSKVRFLNLHNEVPNYISVVQDRQYSLTDITIRNILLIPNANIYFSFLLKQFAVCWQFYEKFCIVLGESSICQNKFKEA